MVNVQQEYVQCASGGNVTAPVNGNWLQAYCEYLGITQPVNLSWLVALCNHFGITAPLYGSWTIALANYYGISSPAGYGTWWNAIQAGVCGGTPVVPCTWGGNLNTFGTETRVWSSTTACTAPPVAVLWEGASDNWEAEPDNWESI
jgi:hypothetical protein